MKKNYNDNNNKYIGNKIQNSCQCMIIIINKIK